MQSPHLMPNALAVLLAAGLSANALASQSNRAVIPPRFATERGNVGESAIVCDNQCLPSHTQVGYDVNDFPRSVMLLTAVAFRRESMGSTTNLATTARMSIAVSHGAVPPYAFSTEFARNEGTDRTVVFTGDVNFPRVPPTNGVPAFVPRIPFARASLFVRARGRSFVMDIKTSSSTSNAWPIDAFRPERNQTKPNYYPGPNCKDSSGRQNLNYLVRDHIAIGGSYEVWYFPGPVNSAGIMTVGTKKAGEWWGNVRLPFVVPTTYDCFWATDALVTWPFRIDAQGWAKVPPLPIPYDKGLVGKQFCDQPLFFDARGPAIGFITAHSHCVTIRDAHNIVFIAALNDSPPARKGSKRVGRGVIVEFTY